MSVELIIYLVSVAVGLVLELPFLGVICHDGSFRKIKVWELVLCALLCIIPFINAIFAGLEIILHILWILTLCINFLVEKVSNSDFMNKNIFERR